MIHNNTLYLSRSAIEDYLSCNEYYYYLYHHPDKDGIERGVHPAKPVRALELGTAAHKAIEFMMRRLMLKQKMEVAEKRTGIKQQLPEVDLNTAIFKLITEHLISKFKTPDAAPDVLWTIRNDAALVYGLVLMFKATVMDEIEKGHTILEVETEHTYFTMVPGTYMLLESRPDWVTIEKETGDMIVWNLKTSKYGLEEDSRVDRSYTHDLQGLLESWVIEREMLEVKATMDNLPSILDGKINIGIPLTVSGVRYVFLVKGKDEGKKNPQTGTYDGRYETYSPIVRAWKNVHFTDAPRYAWDNQIEKPENKSGFGYLGKDWEVFTPWEEPALGVGLKDRVETWVRVLLEGGDENIRLQPEHNPRLVQIPDDKRRTEEEKSSIGNELADIASTIVEQLNGKKIWFKNRKRCTYPFKCQYYEWCREGKDIKGAIESGELVGREPNHPKEGTGLVQIRNERKGLQ